MLLVCLPLIVFGVLVAVHVSGFGWVVAGFFAIGVVVCLLQFMPDCSYLRVSSKGLEIRSLFRSTFLAWNDVDRFDAGRMGRNEMVLVKFAEASQTSRSARKIAKFMTGAEGALPDTYGFTAEGLADRLNQWKSLVTLGNQPQGLSHEDAQRNRSDEDSL
jgi:hypothetical protein